ncbi:MAG: class I SAM-dependent methyltransferase [Candidatus Eisenbacteria bacterium]|uniref:Class I SAM-dependent methyltransferase n=1 Tax=Eiseniibacteriota bacterium TaxID=2212470 RepID=A0A7Y2H3Y8_UNCEI|nr:class I SAM-dependent methyltransferase [Candidatus Eisenbacteria bacterium]
MPNLLLHSMAEFAEILLTSLEIAGAKDVVEIGAEYGTMTRELMDYTEGKSGSLVAIDPSPSPELKAMFGESSSASLVEDLSLNAIPELTADAWIVDGDHNYYTVLNESKLIWERCQADKRPFLVFYHDVGWPCARRDQYCAPHQIPKDFRQPFSWDHGIALDNDGVVEGGFRGNGNWAPALKEGGEKNGVLTAIDDFVTGKEEHLLWARIPAVFGLGVLFSNQAPWTETLSALLMPYHENPLLERLERNRLECYLRVLEWQDGIQKRSA